MRILNLDVADGLGLIQAVVADDFDACRLRECIEAGLAAIVEKTERDAAAPS